MKTPILLQIRWFDTRETLLIEPSSPPKTGDLYPTTELWDGESEQIDWEARVRNYESNGTAHKLELEYTERQNPHLADLDVLYGTSTIVFDTKTKKCTATWANKPPSKKWDGPVKGKLLQSRTGEFLGYVATLRRKRKQELFKSTLLKTVRSCELTGESVAHALDAAHIVEVRSDGSHDPTNGLLLRADLHRLFDRRLLCIDPANGSITLSTEVPVNSKYHELVGHLKLSPSSLSRVRNNLAKRAKGG